MDEFMEEPKPPDYYADLGVLQTATFQEIKRAHILLAKKHHPDKQGVGNCADAHEFRRIREAFEFLRDASKRFEYDRYYPQLRETWAQYHTKKRKEELRRAEKIASQRRAAEAEKARREEEERRIAREKAERAKKAAEAAAEAKEARKRAEEELLAREKKERERTRALKEALAEQRSQEVAQRAREQQKHAARERLRKQKEMEAERKSKEAAIRARLEQEMAAKERLKTILIEEKHKTIRQNWAQMREAAECQQSKLEHPETQGPLVCDHPRLGWPRRKGIAICVFCGEICRKFSFHCPRCDLAACQACKVAYCVLSRF
ncbi:DnaJ-domain-containing protein [Melanomma pulvis-pyrius CBS 109.77]|uniref:DnaJ-domain-containing protein n=1 Tax=Melanomma pulvis-pyrius CBS 109.77 TaxID=1314802 RepID=A0A6A6WS00_9PLEO|nr:DnaJ-domain-containing protein [Melanomma pulvis-pyrius CBS 109.77]